MEPHILLFDDADPVRSGHHAEYIAHLIEYWLANGMRGRLDVAADPGFAAIYPQLAELFRAGSNAGVELIPLQRHDGQHDGRIGGPIRRSLGAGRLLKACVERVRPMTCMLMFFDHLQPAFAAGLRFPFAVRFAGIYFRPTFHYGTFANSRLGISDRVRQLRQRVTLSLAVHNPHLTTLFCLDHYSVPFVRRLRPGLEAVALADPHKPAVEGCEAAAFKRSLGVAEGRRIMLFFGDLTRRKGIFQLLEAVALLPESVVSRISLFLAGESAPADRDEIAQCCQRFKRRDIQLVLIDRRISDREMHGLFAVADLVLLPYQRQPGMSGVLLRAAAAQVPVLGSDYGLLGELIRRRRLGIAVDGSDPARITDAIEASLSYPPDELFDREEARRFAAENSAEKYADTIFTHLIGGT